MPRSNFKIRSWAHVKRLMVECPLIVEVTDARMIGQTRIRKLEGGFRSKLIIAATKADLLEKMPFSHLEKNVNIVYCSSRTREGIDTLKKMIEDYADEKITKHRYLAPINVIIFGLPNVGKSSLINALTGRRAAKTGFRSGITRGVQWINMGTKIRFMDAPGIVDIATKNEDLAMTSSIDVERLKNPHFVAQRILNKFVFGMNDSIFKYYGVEKSENIDEVLSAIATKRGKLQKGGEPHIDEAAKILIRDWQKGKIRL